MAFSEYPNFNSKTFNWQGCNELVDWISESFYHFFSILQKRCPNHYPKQPLFTLENFRIIIWHIIIFWTMEQNLSGIKPPLYNGQNKKYKISRPLKIWLRCHTYVCGARIEELQYTWKKNLFLQPEPRFQFSPSCTQHPSR